MKICHVTSVHSPEDGRIFRRACISCVKAGYETFLVERGDSYVKDNVKIIGLGNPRNNSRIYRMTLFSFKAFIEAVKINADLYHLHDPELLPYALCFKMLGKKVVFDSHENYVEQIRIKSYLPFKLGIVFAFIYDKYSRFIFSHIDGLTYPGDGTKTYFDSICSRVVTTDNLPWLSELYDNYDRNNQQKYNAACYIGGLDKSRGLIEMIKACYQAGCKLYLAGSYSSDSLKKEVENMPEYDCVEYLGVLDRPAIVDLLNHVSVGLCVLHDVGQYYKMNNLPTKIYEYMSMALPVIMNDSPYNLCFNDRHQIGICVEPSNVTQLSQALRFLIDNKEINYKLGETGRNLVLTKYCWNKEQQNLLNLYKDIFE